MDSIDKTAAIEQYKEYVYNHILKVRKAYNFIKTNAPEILYDLNGDQEAELDYNISHHDDSKFSNEELEPYAEFFYGEKDENGERPKNVKLAFEYAWNHHQKNNPHHWEYWIGFSNKGTMAKLEIPDIYLIEMICDWLSFQMDKPDISGLFTWYDNKSKDMIMNRRSEKRLRECLNILKSKM